jgi:hypothetical protein
MPFHQQAYVPRGKVSVYGTRITAIWTHDVRGRPLKEKQGKETWTFATEEQAKESFKEMVARWRKDDDETRTTLVDEA